MSWAFNSGVSSANASASLSNDFMGSLYYFGIKGNESLTAAARHDVERNKRAMQACSASG
jgi:hypothetical protein